MKNYIENCDSDIIISTRIEITEILSKDLKCTIMYKKQIKLNNEIKCLYTKEQEQSIVTIKSADNKLLHAIIKLY